ncbi:MAG: PilZ domain-containing protein [Deltaproteobacteria bacterium]|nr:PilZ domain-containing protein [Deltaproteobacteria bacterium]
MKDETHSKTGLSKGGERAGVRVQVPIGLDVEAGLAIEEEQFLAAKVVDLSLQGVLLTLPREKVSLYQVKQKVQVKLSVGEDEIYVDGVVRHLRENRVGVFFSVITSGDARVAERVLSRMVRTLERKHLRLKAMNFSLS